MLAVAENSDDSKFKRETEPLLNYEIKSFKFLVTIGMWYVILFAVNTVVKRLQSSEMQINGLINFLENIQRNWISLGQDGSIRNSLCN